MKLPGYLCLSRHRVYKFRRRIPDDLAYHLQGREIRLTLGTSDRREAIRKARIAAVETDAIFQTIRSARQSGGVLKYYSTLQIKLLLRAKLMSLNGISTPISVWGELIQVSKVAQSLGISEDNILGELLNYREAIFVYASNWFGYQVDDIDSVERDYDDSFLINDVEAKGIEVSKSGFVRVFDSGAALAALLEHGKTSESVFLLSEQCGLFLGIGNAKEISTKGIFARRNALARFVTTPDAFPLPPPVSANSTSAELLKAIKALDPITANHGKKRFSELFETYKNTKVWGLSQTKRMIREAGLFRDLMDDPQLETIDTQLIHEYARLLAKLPTDIYQAKRRFGIESLHELIDIAGRENLETKNGNTVKGHIGKLSEIFGYGASDDVRMLKFNPAANFKRGDSKKAKGRPQDDRDTFSTEDLKLIFSQEWFINGAGKISSSGVAKWRPYYYWLPLLGLFTGARLNEISQLYLKDIVQAEGSKCWYLDFNLDGAGKLDADGSGSQIDKSLKTVNSIRIVPLHDILIELGLPKYAKALREAGYDRLFPELKHDAVKGYGKGAGSWFNERFLGHKLKIERNGKKAFHSFRHCFADALGRAGVPESITAQLNGHLRGKTESYARYKKDADAGQLKLTIDRLDPSIVDHVKPFKISEAILAVKYALGLKEAMMKRKSSNF